MVRTRGSVEPGCKSSKRKRKVGEDEQESSKKLKSCTSKNQAKHAKKKSEPVKTQKKTRKQKVDSPSLEEDLEESELIKQMKTWKHLPEVFEQNVSTSMLYIDKHLVISGHACLSQYAMI